MALLFNTTEFRQDLGQCTTPSPRSNFCFDFPAAAETTKKLFDRFFVKHYGSPITGDEFITGSGGSDVRRNNHSIVWHIGTPRVDNDPDLLGGSGPRYFVKCDKANSTNSSCVLWKDESHKYPDPAPHHSKCSPGDIHSSWHQSPPGWIHWYDADVNVADTVSFAKPDSDYIYSLDHSPCKESLLRNNQILKESTDCENLPLLNNFLDAPTGPENPTPSPSDPIRDPSGPTPHPSDPTPVPTSSYYSSYMKIGVGTASTLFFAYNMCQEARKFLNDKESAKGEKQPSRVELQRRVPEPPSTKRLLGYSAATAVSAVLTIHAIRV